MFRNVIALCAAAALLGCSSMPSMPSFLGGGWTTLIDGASGLQNWDRVGDANWRAEDGAIVADGKGKDNGYLVTKQPYGDFQIRVEFWASDNANSGIYMRCSNPKVITDKSCYEANIFDQRSDPTYGTGAIVHVSPIKPVRKAGGKWNTYDITLKGSHLQVTLNGEKTADVQHAQHKSGPVALQYAAGVIKFRKVQIRPL
jgi:hypothetical protein